MSSSTVDPELISLIIFKRIISLKSVKSKVKVCVSRETTMMKRFKLSHKSRRALVPHHCSATCYHQV